LIALAAERGATVDQLTGFIAAAKDGGHIKGPGLFLHLVRDELQDWVADGCPPPYDPYGKPYDPSNE